MESITIFHEKKYQTNRGIKKEMISFNHAPHSNFTLISFEIEGSLDPKDLPDILSTASLLPIDPKLGVVLSGKGPVWLYAALTHLFHPTAWVGTFDPRLGVVVVESHCPTRFVGEILPI